MLARLSAQHADLGLMRVKECDLRLKSHRRATRVYMCGGAASIANENVPPRELASTTSNNTSEVIIAKYVTEDIAHHIYDNTT